MYSVNNLPNQSALLQNMYATCAKPSSYKEHSDIVVEELYAPSAESQYSSQSAQTSSITPNNFYDTLVNLAVSSPKENKFEDMYVRSSANLCRTSDSDRALLSSGQRAYMDVSYSYSLKKDRATQNHSCICVPIGAGEFPQFMDNIRQDLADGLTLTDALQNRIDEYKKKNNTQGIANRNADLFYINPQNGDVVAVYQKARVTGNNDHDAHFTDEDATLELADDLATFLRYAAFGSDDDDPEKVERLMSFLSSKQAYANYDRYIFDEDADESIDNAAVANQILAMLIGAGVLKGDEDDEEEQETAIDGLMDAIRIHQEDLYIFRRKLC